MDSVTEINVMQPSIAQISKQKQQEKDKKTSISCDWGYAPGLVDNLISHGSGVIF